MSSDLEARFKKAVWLIRNGPKRSSSNETKLSFYKYYKQVRRFLLCRMQALGRGLQGWRNYCGATIDGLSRDKQESEIGFPSTWSYSQSQTPWTR